MTSPSKRNITLYSYFVRLGVNEGDEVLLVAHGDGLPVRRPVDVDVLAPGGDGGHALGGAGVPYPHAAVGGGRGQEVGVGRVPAQLVHAVGVALVRRLPGEEIEKDSHGVSKGTSSSNSL